MAAQVDPDDTGVRAEVVGQGADGGVLAGQREAVGQHDGKSVRVVGRGRGGPAATGLVPRRHPYGVARHQLTTLAHRRLSSSQVGPRR